MPDRPDYVPDALDNLPVDRRGDAWEPPRIIIPGEPAPRTGYQFRALNSALFAAADYRPQWLVRNMLVRNQPAVIGAPRKGLKTSIAIDLAISLGTTSPFLGVFTVTSPCRVLLLSGESGPHTIQETARRICTTKNLELSAATNCFWDFNLPQLSKPNDLNELQRGLRANAIDGVIIDPIYLCLLGGTGAQPSSMYEMGPLFQKVANCCLEVGCTPILLHHFRQTRSGFELPDLGDLAYAGIQEFARQWLLLCRRAAYVPGSGLHELWLTSGGSIGHGGTWAIDVDEGRLNDDFGGRKWDVTVTTHSDAIQTSRASADVKKREKQEAKETAQDTKLLVALDAIAGTDGSAGMTKVRDAAGLNSAAMTQTVLRLTAKSVIEEVPVQVPSGAGTRTVAGLRRVRPNDQQDHRDHRDGLFGQ